MWAFALGRITRLLVTVWAVVTICFIATRVTGNPIDFLMPEGLDATSREEMIAYWGLDGSYGEQYLLYWKSLLSGDFGLGFQERRPVIDIFLERVPQSATLLVAAMLMTVAIGVPTGVFAAVKRRSTGGHLAVLAAFLGYAIPNFVLAIVMVLVFSFWLNWLPSSGSASLAHFIMPTIALSAYFVAALVRYTRNAMLDILSQDYMRTARAKGVPEWAVIFKHGLRNALIPIITVIGLQMTTLVSGAVVIETVFAWNGVGDLLVGAALRRDYPVLQFGVLIVSIAVIFINLLIDIAYVAVDPRIKIGA